MNPTKFIGIDVQAARGCPYAVLGERGQALDSGWVGRADHGKVVQGLRDVVTRHSARDSSQVAIGIDAPRKPLSSPRRWYWEGRRSAWRVCCASDRGNGRHCEIVIAAHRLANPQWTPHDEPVPEWMQLGFELFAGLSRLVKVYEVFPSASYALLRGDSLIQLGIQLGSFALGPKDMLDAYVAAATVREFVHGRGEAVGGGDGYGQIILPRPLPHPIHAVLLWPAG